MHQRNWTLSQGGRLGLWKGTNGLLQKMVTRSSAIWISSWMVAVYLLVAAKIPFIFETDRGGRGEEKRQQQQRQSVIYISETHIKFACHFFCATNERTTATTCLILAQGVELLNACCG